MTYQELVASEPRVRGEVILDGEDGKRYKTFVCHGCQSCWSFADEQCEQIVESYPHFLAPLEEVR